MKFLFSTLTLAFTAMIGPVSAQSDASRPIWFGTTLDPQTVMTESERLAKSLADPTSPQWRAKGDQRRTYRFAEANADEPYRVCVPNNWDGTTKLPLAMFLHGAGSNESTYLDQNNKQIVKLADEHGFLLVSPKGDNGAYGNFLRLSAPFGNEEGAAQLMAQVTAASEKTNQLSEKDVINVLELVLAEYPVDRSSMFLFGHSMGSGGTWYIGGKYRNYWKGLAPMSGPFVQESGYPWDSLRQMSFFVTEGTQTPSLDGSRAVRDWMNKNGFKLKYEEVNADHGGMIRLVLPHIFDFFDSCRTATVAVSEKRNVSLMPHATGFSADNPSPQMLRIILPPRSGSSKAIVSILDLFGRKRYIGAFSVEAGEARMNGIRLPVGIYRACIKTDSGREYAALTVVR